METVSQQDRSQGLRRSPLEEKLRQKRAEERAVAAAMKAPDAGGEVK